MSVSEEALLLDGFESGIKRRAIEHVLSLHCSMEKGHAMSFIYLLIFRHRFAGSAVMGGVLTDSLGYRGAFSVTGSCTSQLSVPGICLFHCTRRTANFVGNLERETERERACAA